VKRSPLRKYNRKRQAKRKAGDRVKGSYFRWAKTKPCTFLFRGNHRCWGGMTAHHVRSVGAGGEDFENCLPVCEGMHSEIHSSTKEEIWMRYQVDMRAEAKRLAKEYPV